MEEKQIKTNEQLEAEINSARAKETFANVLIYGAGAALILMFCLKKSLWLSSFWRSCWWAAICGARAPGWPKSSSATMLSAAC